MPKSLTPAQIEQYREDGCVFPIRVMPEEAALELRARLEAFEQQPAVRSRATCATSRTCCFPGSATSCAGRDPRRDRGSLRPGPPVLDHQLLYQGGAEPRLRLVAPGLDLLGLDRPDVVTAWVALTEATRPTARWTIPRHPQARPDPAPRHLRQAQSADARPGGRGRGRPLAAAVITLRPGEMSLHHVRLVHGSPPNPSGDRRIGFAIRYIPTTVAQLAGEDSATLVRGEDRHHHFAPEPHPTRDLDPEFVALHEASPSATPRSSTAAPRSPVTTTQRLRRSAAEPAPGAG